MNSALTDDSPVQTLIQELVNNGTTELLQLLDQPQAVPSFQSLGTNGTLINDSIEANKMLLVEEKGVQLLPLDVSLNLSVSV